MQTKTIGTRVEVNSSAIMQTIFDNSFNDKILLKLATAIAIELIENKLVKHKIVSFDDPYIHYHGNKFKLDAYVEAEIEVVIPN
jgi:hypothetical protein